MFCYTPLTTDADLEEELEIMNWMDRTGQSHRQHRHPRNAQEVIRDIRKANHYDRWDKLFLAFLVIGGTIAAGLGWWAATHG